MARCAHIVHFGRVITIPFTGEGSNRFLSTVRYPIWHAMPHVSSMLYGYARPQGCGIVWRSRHTRCGPDVGFISNGKSTRQGWKSQPRFGPRMTHLRLINVDHACTGASQVREKVDLSPVLCCLAPQHGRFQKYSCVKSIVGGFGAQRSSLFAMAGAALMMPSSYIRVRDFIAAQSGTGGGPWLPSTIDSDDQLFDQIWLPICATTITSWELRPTGIRRMVPEDGEEVLTAQSFLTNPSLSGRWQVA